MNVPKKILVAVDFNDLSTAALRVASAIAVRTGGSLVLLYADTFEPPAEFTSPQLLRIARAIESSRRRAKEELEECAKRNTPAGLEHLNVVIDSLPVHAITSYAEGHEIDLIAMGTHGRGGIQRMLLGSVAEHVMSHTTVPVLTVHDPARVRSVERIAATIGARDYAAALGRALSAAVRVIERDDIDTIDSADCDLIVAEQALRQIRRVVRHAHVPVIALPILDRHLTVLPLERLNEPR